MADLSIDKIINAIPGASEAVKYIRSEAEAGAKQAIPEIRRQVKDEVTPLVVGAIGAGAIGALMGLIGIIVAVRK